MKSELTDGGSPPQSGLAPPDMSGQSQQTIVRAPPPAGSVAASRSVPRLTKDDALEYLKKVKEIFQDHKGKYIEFLQLMKEFKSKRMDRNGVIMRVKELFEGNPDLILGFNNFLPIGYEIKLDEKEHVEFDEAIKLVYKVQEHFGNGSNEFKTFLSILRSYKEGTISLSEVYEEAVRLFRDKKDFLAEFRKFLPPCNCC